MFALFNRFFDLTLMRLPPQEFPASRFLLMLVLTLFALLTFMSNFVLTENLAYSLARSGMSIGTVGAAAALLLFATRRAARWQQTVTALYGGEVVLMVFMLPVLVAYVLNIENLFIMISQWLLIIWEIAFIAHVYRNALDSSMATGVIVAIVYIVASAVLKQELLPFPAGG